MFSRKTSRNGENFHAGFFGGVNTGGGVFDGDGVGGFDDLQVFEGKLVGGGIGFALFSVFRGDDGAKVFFDVMSRDDRFDVGSKGAAAESDGKADRDAFYELNGTR